MNVLAIGAHPDDIEIGLGGTIKKHAKKGDDVFALIMSNGDKLAGSDKRKKEAENSADFLGIKKILFLDIPDTKIEFKYELVNKIEEFIEDEKIDRIYTHSQNDVHLDHLNTNRCVLFATRRKVKQILFFESPSSNLDFNPVFFVDIADEINDKIKSLTFHESIMGLKNRNYLHEDSIKNTAIFRGSQSHVKFAEGFEIFRYLEI